MSISNPSSPISRSPLVDKTLDVYLNNKRSRECLQWGSINIVLLSIIFFDISSKCPYSFSQWYYLEYAAAGILSCSALYYFARYFYYIFSKEPLTGTENQRKLLKFEVNDKSFIIKTPKSKSKLDTNTTPTNVLSVSLHSFNNSGLTATSPGWVYNRGSTPQTPIDRNASAQNYSFEASFNASPNTSSHFSPSLRRAANKADFIVDEKGLQHYLREVSNEEKNNSSYLEKLNTSASGMNSFWNSYKMDDMSNLLKTSLYQLSPSAPPSKQIIKEHESGSYNPIDPDVSSEVLNKVSSVQLSNYVANLRMWISLTILQRIVSEMESIDASFKNRGFSDIQLGSVGLERLKKTAENQHLVTMYIPRLPLLIPFLEMSTNQEYLVQRIRDLSKGSCITDYRWNSGSSYKGLNWDEHLPTDSAVIFHLFCTYMDSQLRPLPQPGGRPFYHRYVVMADKTSPKETLLEVKTKNKAKCAILCTNPMKPKFNFISDDKIHTCAHDRNNLYYVIIQFLIYMKNNHEGLVEGINLGKSGINILCVLED
ncbi:transmembrane protein 209 [Toxorhynchites rutilus septentrionalis]|uniref:transmembrane protein 209 n=1 Tax=Toxorhynchites rutilus septentrionalis TaxID=329112 RepID=UPI0024793000|nr:transmembrane protein 209 [Toxorhynchites rutilus septentrionalis]